MNDHKSEICECFFLFLSLLCDVNVELAGAKQAREPAQLGRSHVQSCETKIDVRFCVCVMCLITAAARKLIQNYFDIVAALTGAKWACGSLKGRTVPLSGRANKKT